jgi:2-haloalkanoic acid dehalogenase type II
MSVLKAAFFDLDDTLCDDAAAWIICARMASELAKSTIPDTNVLAEAFLKHSESYWMSFAPVHETRPLLEIRASQWADALNDVCGQSDPELAEKLGRDYGERRSKEIKLFPDVEETLSKLRADGIILALLTNGVQLTHNEKIQYLGLDKAFDHVLVADAVGYFKPQPQIFWEALRRCHCRPEEAIMVGDHLRNDIDGAQAVGITAYWFNPSGHKRGVDDPIPDGEIAKLSEILPLIEDRLP